MLSRALFTVQYDKKNCAIFSGNQKKIECFHSTLIKSRLIYSTWETVQKRAKRKWRAKVWIRKLFVLCELFHKLSEPKSVSYRILVWTGLFISFFERAHEPAKILNEAMSGSKALLVCLGIFIGKNGLDGYFYKEFWTRTSTISLYNQRRKNAHLKLIMQWIRHAINLQKSLLMQIEDQRQGQTKKLN